MRQIGVRLIDRGLVGHGVLMGEGQVEWIVSQRSTIEEDSLGFIKLASDVLQVLFFATKDLLVEGLSVTDQRCVLLVALFG